MIGNTIEYNHYDWANISRNIKEEIREGLVVDAFTEVTGHISGSNDVFLGFGGGSTSGRTDSKRKYKVEYFSDWDKEKKHPTYEDIYAWQLTRIISLAKNINQEKNEEKIIV